MDIYIYINIYAFILKCPYYEIKKSILIEELW